MAINAGAKKFDIFGLSHYDDFVPKFDGDVAKPPYG